MAFQGIFSNLQNVTCNKLLWWYQYFPFDSGTQAQGIDIDVTQGEFVKMYRNFYVNEHSLNVKKTPSLLFSDFNKLIDPALVYSNS